MSDAREAGPHDEGLRKRGRESLSSNRPSPTRLLHWPSEPVIDWAIGILMERYHCPSSGEVVTGS